MEWGREVKKGCLSYINSYNSISFKILKQLRIKTSLKGTKFVIDAISIIANYDDEPTSFEEIYREISTKYNLSPVYIRSAIKYVLDNRNNKLAEKNFEKIFGYEYNEYSFTNKELIQEIVRVVLYETYSIES